MGRFNVAGNTEREGSFRDFLIAQGLLAIRCTSKKGSMMYVVDAEDLQDLANATKSKKSEVVFFMEHEIGDHIYLKPFVPEGSAAKTSESK